MEKEEKKEDLAPETSKVEDINIKIDATEVTEAVKKLAETVEKMTPPKVEDIPGAPPVESEKDKKDLDRYSIREAIFKEWQSKVGKGKLDGVELEMHQEAVKEGRVFSIDADLFCQPTPRRFVIALKIMIEKMEGLEGEEK